MIKGRGDERDCKEERAQESWSNLEKVEEKSEL